MLIALALMVQVFVNDADQVVMTTDSGSYVIELGDGCDGLVPPVDAEWLAGSGGVGAIVPVDTDMVCNVYIEGIAEDQ
jgi:hypothetical protein